VGWAALDRGSSAHLTIVPLEIFVKVLLFLTSDAAVLVLRGVESVRRELARLSGRLEAGQRGDVEKGYC
jgi:hypothetical protein